jgi:hypothetical protein
MKRFLPSTFQKSKETLKRKAQGGRCFDFADLGRSMLRPYNRREKEKGRAEVRRAFVVCRKLWG